MSRFNVVRDDSIRTALREVNYLINRTRGDNEALPHLKAARDSLRQASTAYAREDVNARR